MKFGKLLFIVFLLFQTFNCLNAQKPNKEQPTGLDILNKKSIEFNEINFYRYLSKDKAEIIKAFLDAGYDVNKPNQASQTPLMVAAQRGAINVCAALLDRGANVNAVDCDSSTALMYAVSYKKVRTTTLLIERGADVNIQNDKGWTALMFAIESGSRDIIDAVITIDTDPMLRNKDNKTARDFARAHRFDKLPKYIADKIAYLQKQKAEELKKGIAKPKKF